MKKSCVVNVWWWNWLGSCKTTLGLLNTYISHIVQVVSADGRHWSMGYPYLKYLALPGVDHPWWKLMCVLISSKNMWMLQKWRISLMGLIFLFTLIRKMVPMHHHGPPETRPEKDNNCDVYITSHTCHKSVLPWGHMLKRLGKKCFAFSNAMRMTLANLILGGTSVAV